MKLLLDTHAFLWSMSNDRLSRSARDAFLNAENQLFLSAASYWEICLKISIGKLHLAAQWPDIFAEQMMRNQIQWMPITANHCQTLLDLPFHHRDPFDRMLVAQGITEELALITADAQFNAYDVEIIW